MQRTADELEHRIWQAAADLRHAASGDQDACYHLSNALDSIRHATGAYHRISGRQRGMLLDELMNVRRQVSKLFSELSAQALAIKGIDALAAIVINWADADDDRERRDRHQMADIRASARILQNMCHNASLITEISERARHRRATKVQEIIEQALHPSSRLDAAE